MRAMRAVLGKPCYVVLRIPRHLSLGSRWSPEGTFKAGMVAVGKGMAQMGR